MLQDKVLGVLQVGNVKGLDDWGVGIGQMLFLLLYGTKFMLRDFLRGSLVARHGRQSRKQTDMEYLFH